MKKLIILYFIVIFNVLSTGFEAVNSFGAKVEERTFINGRWREKVYTIKLEYPDMVIKEVLEPKINKGEIILYKANKKWIYYPIFDESFEEELDGEENYILSALRYIKEGRGSRVEEEGRVINLLLDSDLELVFKDYTVIDNIDFPKEIYTYDNGNLISEVRFSNIELNKNYDKSTFKIGS